MDERVVPVANTGQDTMPDTGHTIPDTGKPSRALSAREAAAELGVDERTIRRAIARGELRAAKLGRAFRIIPAELARYRRLHPPGSPPPPNARGAPAIVGPAPGPLPPLRLVQPDLATPADPPCPLTALVGRERELAAVCEVLQEPDVRLVTLTGPGGVGKTRLALAVAAALRRAFADGVAFVPLAPIRDPSLVVPAIATAVGVRQGAGPIEEGLVKGLRGRHLLLVLDNLEQVPDAAPALAGLLAACPDLKALAISRSALRVSGEHRFPVPPLALPDPKHLPPLATLATVEAVRLFVARAEAADPGFALTEANAATVAEVCRRLDGLPLAIELAAARAPVLAPQALLARLDRRLGLLNDGPRDAPSRLRSLRGTIAWSHDLLDEDARVLLRRLAVFAGGCSLEAAEAVVGVGEARRDGVLAGVAALVEQSLLRREAGPDGEPRFAMLESVREFAAEQLAASGEEAPVRAAHMRHFLALAEEAERGLLGPGQVGWQRRLEADHADLRAALDWSVGHDPQSTLRLATALWRFWWAFPAEGLAWLERALAGAANDAAVLRTKALGSASILASYRGDAGHGAELARQAVGLAEAGGDEAGRAWGLVMLSFAERCRGDQAASALHAEAAVAISTGLGEGPWFTFLAAGNLLRAGHEAYERGDWFRAEAALREALDRWRHIGYPWGIGVALVKLADVARASGDGVRAASLYRASLDHWEVLRHELAGVEALIGLARLAALRRPAAAVRLLAAVEELQARTGLVPAPVLRDQAEAALADARAALGEGTFEVAWVAGQALSPDELLREAKAAADPVPPSPPAREHLCPPAPYDLTRRELEVLGLVAGGRTDREVAAALFLSPRTVHHHVASLLAKLGAGSRTAAVAAALAAGLLPPDPPPAP